MFRHIFQNFSKSFQTRNTLRFQKNSYRWLRFEYMYSKQLPLIPLHISCFNKCKLQHRHNDEKNIYKNIYEEGRKLESRGQRSKKKNAIEHSISHKTFESDFVSQMSLTCITNEIINQESTWLYKYFLLLYKTHIKDSLVEF